MPTRPPNGDSRPSENQPLATMAPPDGHEMPIGQILTILWRGRWLILISTLLALASGIVYVQQRGTIHRAASRLYVQRDGPRVMGPESLFFVSEARNYANTQAELLRSTDVLTSALAASGIASSPIFEQVDNRIAWLKRKLAVDVGKKDDIITVSLDSRHCADACRLVNAVVDSYRQQHAATKKSTASEMLKTLTAAKEKAVTDLDARLDALTTFRKKNGAVGFDREGVRVVTERLRTWNTMLTEAEAKTVAARAQLDVAEALSGDPTSLRQILPLVAARGNTVNLARDDAQLVDQMQKLEVRAVQLRSDLKPDHPQVKELEDQIESLRQQLAGRDSKLCKAWVDSVKHEWIAAKTVEDNLRAKVAEQEKQAAALNDTDAEFTRLSSQYDRALTWVTDLDGRIKIINTSDVDSTVMTLQVLDVAKPETATVASSKAATVGIFLFLGLLLGTGLAWLRGAIDTRLRTADEVMQGVGLPVLGIMPRTDLSGDETDAIDTWEKHSGLAEAARSLRTAVYFGIPDGEGKVIQVTSPDPGDGKSMISSKLAIAMAQSGQRTLLIDADLRRPKQAALFRLPADEGLSNVLATGGKADDYIQTTRIEHLDLLPSGPIPANPAEVLNSKRFGDLIADLSTLYDRIVIDSPPVLPVADARIIATKADYTLLVLRVDKSTRKRASAARDSLAAVNARVLGAAINDMPRGIGYGYGAGYGHYYNRGYGYGDQGQRNGDADSGRDPSRARSAVDAEARE